MVVSILVGFMLFSAKRYCEELTPTAQVWGYEDIAFIAFGPIGKVHTCVHIRVYTIEHCVCLCVFERGCV